MFAAASAPAFEVIGISARTDNVDEAGPNGAIPRLWKRFLGDHLLDTIPNRTGTDVIAVYTEYASDEHGAFTYVLGAKVKPESVAPEGMVKVHVPAGGYAVFSAERGPAEKVVPAAWQRIWKAFPADGASQRAFKADYEVYGKGPIEIYIGVK